MSSPTCSPKAVKTNWILLVMTFQNWRNGSCPITTYTDRNTMLPLSSKIRLWTAVENDGQTNWLITKDVWFTNSQERGFFDRKQTLISKKRRQRCEKWRQRTRFRYGENLFFFGARHLPTPQTLAAAIVQSFYLEGIGYNYSRYPERQTMEQFNNFSFQLATNVILQNRPLHPTRLEELSQNWSWSLYCQRQLHPFPMCLRFSKYVPYFCCC